MALASVLPMEPDVGSRQVAEPPPLIMDRTAELRINLTRPSDKDNELIKVAAVQGAPGILEVLRAHREYGWFVTLGLRAIEVCLGPRGAGMAASQNSELQRCNPVTFSMQMLEIEMIEEIFELMRRYEHLRDCQRAGLAIIELLIMDDQDWRDEVARKGGCALLCEIAWQWKANTKILCQVMTCMAYLAAEDYIEVMLCQHDALEYMSYVFDNHGSDVELVTRAALALLNLTVCEPHVEELMDKGAFPAVVRAFDQHSHDVHLAVIMCGILANFSVLETARTVLVSLGVFPVVVSAMHLEPMNAVLQTACLKAVVNYSMNGDHYNKMLEAGIPTLVFEAQNNHPHDVAVQKYANFFNAQYNSCPIL
jgi:hypothetical protein